tara:strand:+ start:57 stop:257 length:201 start_codon:yes stop_codon:yes gene_type:complete
MCEKILRELRTLLLENKMLVSKLTQDQREDQRSMMDKKTEWSIYQDLKKLGEIDDNSKLNNGERNE